MLDLRPLIGILIGIVLIFILVGIKVISIVNIIYPRLE